MKKTAIILIGIQASGKTSFYRQHFSGLAHINLDTLHTRAKEQKAIEECHKNGLSYVVDNTNPAKEDRARYIPKAKFLGYRVIGYYFRSSVKESLERNSRRDRIVPVIAIAGTSAKLKFPSYSEGFDELYYVRMANGKNYAEGKPEKKFEILPYKENL